MNRFLARWSAPVAALLTLLGFPALAQNNSFTYQGSLSTAGGAVHTTADFKVRLWTAASGGTMVGAEQTFPAVEVSRGVFSLSMPSPSSAFVDGQALWLELDVRSPSGTGAFTTLAPRSAVTPVPLAMGIHGIAITPEGEVLDRGSTGFGANNFQLGPSGSFYQVITPTQSGLLTRVQFQAAEVYNNAAAEVRLRLGQGLAGPVLATRTISPSAGVIEIAFDGVNLVGGQRYTVEFQMTSGVVNARFADKGTPGCPSSWSNRTDPIWFAAYLKPLGLSVRASGAPWSGVTGAPLAVQSDGTLVATSDQITVRPSASGTATPALRVVGRGGFDAIAALDLSTYDPGANAPSARFIANDFDYSSSIDFQTKIAGDITNPLVTRMRLTDDGRLGIGTTAPEALLTVAPSTGGGVLVGSTATAGRTSLYMGINGASNQYSIIQSVSAAGSSYGFLTINPDGGSVAVGTRTPTSGFTLDVNGPLRCVGFTNASSARYRKNVRSIEDDALGRILALRPVRFDWNDEVPSMAGRADVGLIAEEVAQAIPEAVSSSNGKIEGIDYNRLTALMIRALRQEHERSTASTQRLADEASALRAENAELRARLEAIEQTLKR